MNSHHLFDIHRGPGECYYVSHVTDNETVGTAVE